MVKYRPPVALFGGSFDPPHEGHQRIVEALTALDDIDKVIVMPAFLNPFKTSTLASAKMRLSWCKKVFRGDKVIISDFEIAQHRPVYTIETLQALQKEYEVKYLAIGSDNLEKITRWKHFEEINAQVTWLVFTRAQATPDCHLLERCRVMMLHLPVSSTAIRDGRDRVYIDNTILDEVTDTIHNTKDTHDHQREG